MASNQEYLYFVLDLLRGLSGVTYKKMMGEYLLYKDGVLFGGIYDNRFLVKNNEAIVECGLKEAIPYPGAKPMLTVDSENPEEVGRLVLQLIEGLR